MATHLVGERANFHRINPSLPAKRYGLDITRAIPELSGIGDSQARYHLQHLRALFFSSPAEPFVPVLAVG
jgi:hypothetical protein